MYIQNKYFVDKGYPTLAQFKAWCKKFPNPFQEGETPRYYQSKIDPKYFMSLERVRGDGLFDKYDFIGVTIRTVPMWTNPTYTDIDKLEIANKYFPGVLEAYSNEVYGG